MIFRNEETQTAFHSLPVDFQVQFIELEDGLLRMRLRLYIDAVKLDPIELSLRIT